MKGRFSTYPHSGFSYSLPTGLPYLMLSWSEATMAPLPPHQMCTQQKDLESLSSIAFTLPFQSTFYYAAKGLIVQCQQAPLVF